MLSPAKTCTSRTHLQIKLTKVVFQIFHHTTEHKFRTRTYFFINIATHHFKITKSPNDKAIEISALPIYQREEKEKTNPKNHRKN
jgi:hypothetical protein